MADLREPHFAPQYGICHCPLAIACLSRRRDYRPTRYYSKTPSLRNQPLETQRWQTLEFLSGEKKLAGWLCFLGYIRLQNMYSLFVLHSPLSLLRSTAIGSDASIRVSTSAMVF